MAEDIQGREESPVISNKIYCEEALKGRYTILREIGEGAHRSVYQAIHTLTGTEVVIKFLEKMPGSHITPEVDIMKALAHPHTVQLLEILETPTATLLVMEFLGGGQLPCGLGEEEARPLFRQVLWAVAYCHRKGIVHRDLKPENILLDREGKVKVIDFGLSQKVTGRKKLTAFCGTPLFCAPEIYQALPYGLEVDMWALGVLLHYMLTNTFPFEGSTEEQVKGLVVLGKYAVPAQLSTEAQKIIEQLLTVDQARRPTAEAVLGHPWMVQGEYVPPPPKPLRHKKPDALVLRVMRCMGFVPRLTWISVSGRLFNYPMATYRIVQLRVRQAAVQVRREHQRGVAPPPTPAFPLPPVRRASEPARPTRPLLSERSLGEEDMEPGQKGKKRRSLPAMPLCSERRSDSLPDTPLPRREEYATSLSSSIRPSESRASSVHLLSAEKTVTGLPSKSLPGTVHQLSPEGKGSMLGPNWREESPPAAPHGSHREPRCSSALLLPTIAEEKENLEDASMPSREQKQKTGSPGSPRETTPTPSRASQHDLEASAPDNTWGWRRAGRNILGRIVRACCSCLMAQKIHPDSTQEVKAKERKCPRISQTKVSPEKQAPETSNI